MQRQEQEYEDVFEGYAKQLAQGVVRGQRGALERRYGRGLDSRSHGEGFLDLFQSRTVPNGVYLLDEPETPLSPARQLALIALIKDAVDKNCQFIIATHSPILLAYPNAKIYSFDDAAIHQVDFESLEHVTLTRSFLQSPEGYLRRLWEHSP